MGSIDLTFNLLSTCIALVALWIAVSEASRNNRVVLKIVKVGFSGTRDRFGSRKQFTLTLKNQGISLHSPKVILTYIDTVGAGRCDIPLKLRKEQAGEHSEFSRGMIAEFVLSTADVEPRDLDLFLSLKDPTKQQAELVVTTQGYVAKAFRVGGLWDRLALRWSQIAYLINRKFEYKKYNEVWKTNIIHQRLSIPSTRAKHFELMMFIQELRQMVPTHSQNQSQSTSNI